MRLRCQAQDVAHHWVNINIVHRALLVTPMKSRPASSQERMHAWESVVIAVVAYWRNAELRVNITLSVYILSIPLPISPPTPKGIYFNERLMQNIKAAVGSNTEGTQSSSPLPESPEVFSHTGLQPWSLPPPLPQILSFPFGHQHFQFSPSHSSCQSRKGHCQSRSQ